MSATYSSILASSFQESPQGTQRAELHLLDGVLGFLERLCYLR
jgi:hypothetical protein